MSYNGSGVFSIINSFTPATTILSSAVNANFADTATGLSSVLTRDNEAPMTAPLRLADGSLALPGLQFADDTNTGLYRVGADTMALVAGGVEIARISPATGLSGREIGEVFIFAGASAPLRSLLCAGQAVSRTTYAALFDVIGETYGVGDGSTTFNVPDLRGRVVAGQDDMGGASANRLTDQSGGLNGDTLGAAGGAETHVLTEAQLAAHTHAAGTLAADSGGAHRHFVAADVALNNAGFPALTNANQVARQDAESGQDLSYQMSGTSTDATLARSSSDGAHTHTVSGASASTGSGTAHNNVQPTLILNMCIYAGA